MLRIIVAAVFLFVTIAQAHAHGTDQPKHQMARLGEMKLESGMVVPDLRMSYVAYGKLNPTRDNAILLLHGFGANHHSLDALIGPGKPFDTDKYFVVSADQFGSTQVGFEHSTSPTSSGLKMKFPQYNFRDMIQALLATSTRALFISTSLSTLNRHRDARQLTLRSLEKILRIDSGRQVFFPFSKVRVVLPISFDTKSDAQSAIRAQGDSIPFGAPLSIFPKGAHSFEFVPRYGQ